MKQGQDIAVELPGAVIIHQKIQGYAVEEHVHEEHELFLPLQGEISVKAGSEEWKAGPGKMLYIPPKITHTFAAGKSGSGERLIFILSPELWRAEGGGAIGITVCAASQLAKEILFHLLLRPQTRAAGPLLRTLVPTLSEMLEEASAPAAGAFSHLAGLTEDKRLRRALTEIRDGFAAPISAEALARGAGMSVRTLNRLFLHELGATPKQVLTLRRVEEATRLLRARGATVTDVALAVGYGSVSQFITVYRRVTGKLPSEHLSSRL